MDAVLLNGQGTNFELWCCGPGIPPKFAQSARGIPRPRKSPLILTPIALTHGVTPIYLQHRRHCSTCLLLTRSRSNPIVTTISSDNANPAGQLAPTKKTSGNVERHSSSDVELCLPHISSLIRVKQAFAGFHSQHHALCWLRYQSIHRLAGSAFAKTHIDQSSIDLQACLLFSHSDSCLSRS